MADQTHDPRFESLLRGVLAAEVANLPLTVRPNRILERADTRRGARARSRLGRMIFERPTSGLRQTSFALGGMVVLTIVAALGIAILRFEGTSTAAPLPTTPDAWSRLAIGAGPDAGSVVSLAASRNVLLAIVGAGDGPGQLFRSTDGRAWARVPPDQLPAPLAMGPVARIDPEGGAWIVGTDRGFLMFDDGVWTSDDGSDWKPLAGPARDPDLRLGRMLAAAVGGPGYVAVGSDNKAWFSTDGSDWTLAQVPPPPTSFFANRGFGTPIVTMGGVAVDGDRLVAWGSAAFHTADAGMVTPVMWASSDGRTWVNVMDPSDGDVAAVATGPDGFVRITRRDRVVVSVSADGSAWEPVDDLGPSWSKDADGTNVLLGVSSLAATSAGFVATGDLDPVCLFDPCKPSHPVIWASEDGRSWTRLSGDPRFPLGASDIVTWDSRFVAARAHDELPAIWISGLDGPSTTASPIP